MPPIVVTTDTLNEARIRSIIQQELARHTAVNVTPLPEVAARDPIADRAQRDRVDRQLSYLVSAGTFAPNELDDFYLEAMKLPPAARSDVLSRLARAINTRQLTPP